MKKITLMMGALALFVSANVSAQFTEDFEDQGADARWFYEKTGNCTLDYAAKYADLGINAPANGGEYCAMMQANLVKGDDGKGSANFIGIMPKKELKGAYTLTFDAYLYFKGTSGTTEAMTWGVGHEGTDAENEGFRLSITVDNGSSRDIRLYKDGVEQQYDVTSTMFAYSDTLQNANLDAPDITYYQHAYSDNPTPDTNPGNQWLSIKADVTDSAVIFYVNDKEFARFNEVPTGGTILIGYYDPFTGSVNVTSKMLVDNVKIVENALGINERELSNVSVYPNPAKGMVNVSVEGKANFQLFNVSGQSVMNTDIDGDTSIDISSLNSGMYFSRITNEEGASKTLKLQIK
jgi:hypothetical protein